MAVVKPHAVALAATVACSVAMVESVDQARTLGRLAAMVAPAVREVRAAPWPEVVEPVEQVARVLQVRRGPTAANPSLPREADKAALAAEAVRVALRVEKVLKASVAVRV